jgi:hypothetical protein
LLAKNVNDTARHQEKRHPAGTTAACERLIYLSGAQHLRTIGTALFPVSRFYPWPACGDPHRKPMSKSKHPWFECYP